VFAQFLRLCLLPLNSGTGGILLGPCYGVVVLDGVDHALCLKLDLLPGCLEFLFQLDHFRMFVAKLL